jgi:GTP cyclohydrolase I
MDQDKRFLTDVGLTNLPLPIKVASRVRPEGQLTVATINVNARIEHEFEPRWINKFIQIIHRHRENIGTASLRENILAYRDELNASMVKIDFEYPFFIEKLTPVSGEKCLVRYNCLYSAKVDKMRIGQPKVLFRISIPMITTDPASSFVKPRRVLAQLSNIFIEIESAHNVYPEDLVSVAERHALMPVYSFLTEADQAHVIQKIHTEKKSSVEVVDDIKTELASDPKIVWYSVKCSNFSMLHSYSTLVTSEKGAWVSYGEYAEELDREM